MARPCSVFISSTAEDLKEHRLAARDAVLAVGLRPEMMEYFAAGGGPPLPVCLARVSPCDLVVVLVAQRYGWVPPGQPDSAARSITWIECDHAARLGRDVLVFALDPNAAWPIERTEAYRLTAAFNEGTFTPDLPAEIQRNVANIKEFRRHLETGRTCALFTTPDDLRAKLIQGLYAWLEKNLDYKPTGPCPTDPGPYLEWLRGQTGTIDIRGLGEGAGRARNFPIEDLYIPLTTPRQPSGSEQEPGEEVARAPMELIQALAHRRLVIIGDPGSGKTTFLRRIVSALAGAALKGESGALPTLESEDPPGILRVLLSLLKPAGKALPPIPVFIRVAELIEHIDECSRQGGRGLPAEPDSPDWLVHFLAARNARLGWGLGPEFFAGRLQEGEAIILLDGLDEAPGSEQREEAARFFENATQAFRKCRFVVTTRPQPYTGQSVLRGFNEARIEPLSLEAVETFLDRWCRGLYPASARQAEEHRRELSEALRARPEIRAMTRNPVMLTALAVVHWNESRLPEQRADLYESILKWLSRQREKRPGREKAERCLTLLGELAFAMLNHPQGRQVRVTRAWAATALTAHFGPAPADERTHRASQFLEQETADSGIIVSRGGDLQFWHLTFLEYLAAQTIAGLVDSDQVRVLFRDGNLYRPEWREVVLLMAGILKSKPRVDGLVSAILDRTEATLAEQARTIALIGTIVGDLRPLDYQPADLRYSELRDAVLGIFDRQKSQSVEFAVRLGAAEALGQAGDPRLRRDNWVRIPAGMSPAFDIGRYPVTVEEYRRFVEDEGYQNERWWMGGGRSGQRQPRTWEDQKLHPNRPVTRISWYEASAYAAWMGARLPREAEWDWAARGSGPRRYPWGNEEPDATRANYRDTGPGHPTPVGLYPAGATPEGILDLVGNVWEWVEDRHDKNPDERVLRGWSWGVSQSIMPTAVRFKFSPGEQYEDFGFRLARDVRSLTVLTH